MLEGDSPSTLTAKGNPVSLQKNMSNLTFLNDNTVYQIITDFDGSVTPEGACVTTAAAPIQITYQLSPKSAKSFAQVKKDYFFRVNESEYPFKKPGWDAYWFGLVGSRSGADSNIIIDAVGKFKTSSMMSIWYANATLLRTVKKTSSLGVVTIDSLLTYSYPEITNHPDSIALAKALTDDWKKFTKSASQDILITLQMIKITYDSLASPASYLATRKSALGTGFQATQMGQMVIIQPGVEKANTFEPLSIYGMMGNKVASVFPTGFAYHWNGKTSVGSNAPTGVYFIQAGNRVLGKFFYFRN